MYKIIVSTIAAAALLFSQGAAAVPFVPQGADARMYETTEDTTVVFTSCDSIRISGTLTIPRKCKNFPTVVLLSGSGKQNRDGDMAGHAMFRDIAHYLAARGIAVLRMDDRGTGHSTGRYEDATTADFAADALAAVTYLKTRKGIHRERIGLAGHSEGAAAACIAASQSGDVAFVVSLSGLLTDGLSSVIRQNYDLVEASAMKGRDKERYHQIMALMAQTAYEYAGSDSLESQLLHRHDMWKKADDARYNALFHEERDVFRFPVYYYAMEATSRWYRFFIRYNPADYMKDIHVPILAINGDKDMMVHAGLNLSSLKKHTEHNRNVTTRVFPGLNHLLLPCEKGTPDEYRSITAPLPEEVLHTIYQWIKGL